MSEQWLPEGWAWADGSALFAFVTSGSRGWAKHYAESGALFIRIGNLDHASIALDLLSCQRVAPPESGEADRTRVRKGDVLISVTADIGMTALVNEHVGEAYINQHIALARPTQDVHGPYVAWHLASEHGGQRQWRELQRGATKAGLGLDDVRAVKVPLAPLPEQRRIVDKIEELFSKLDAAVAALERVQANLKRYRASVLKAAVEGRLTEEWRKRHPNVEPASELLERILAERRAKWEEAELAKYEAKGTTPPKNWRSKYKEPEPPDTTDLPDLPDRWCWATVEQVTSGARVICYGILKPKIKGGGGVPYVEVKDISGDRVDLAGVNETTPEMSAQFPRSVLTAGDLVLAIRGTYGRVAEVPPELERANVSRDVARLDVCSGIDRAYVATFIRSPVFQNTMRRIARGVAVKGINIGHLRETPVAVPPAAEQAETAASVSMALSLMDATLADVDASLSRASRLRQAILKRAFEGRLVPQDPSDEPASALLERIKKEREKNGKPKRRGPKAALALTYGGWARGAR